MLLLTFFSCQHRNGTVEQVLGLMGEQSQAVMLSMDTSPASVEPDFPN